MSKIYRTRSYGIALPISFVGTDGVDYVVTNTSPGAVPGYLYVCGGPGGPIRFTPGARHGQLRDFLAALGHNIDQNIVEYAQVFARFVFPDSAIRENISGSLDPDDTKKRVMAHKYWGMGLHYVIWEHEQNGCVFRFKTTRNGQGSFIHSQLGE